MNSFDPLSFVIVHPEIGIAAVLVFVLLARFVVRKALPGDAPPAKERRETRRSLIALGALVIVTGCVYAWRRYEPLESAPVRRLSESELAGTLVSPHLDGPILEGKSTIWCATLPMAWDALRKDVFAGAPLQLGAPARPEASAALSAAFLPANAVDAASSVVAAGDGPATAKRFVREVQDRFGESVDLPPVDEGEFAAFAWLAKDLRFPRDFQKFRRGLGFAGSEKRYLAFGINKDSRDESLRELLRQVTVHRATNRGDPSPIAHLEPDEFVLEIALRGGEDRLLLALVPNGPTLRKTWEAVRDASAGAGERLPAGAVLGVPRMNFELVHRFPELEGPIASPALPPGAAIRLVQQHIAFRLDETGVRLRSTAAAVGSLGIDPTFLFDRPFLLALVRRGADTPYLLLWVGNDDLLVPE